VSALRAFPRILPEISVVPSLFPGTGAYGRNSGRDKIELVKDISYQSSDFLKQAFGTLQKILQLITRNKKWSFDHDND